MVVLSSISGPQLVALLRSGATGVLPTDTVYGLVAVASDKRAVARLYSLKQREHKPGTIIAASVEQLLAFGLDEFFVRAAAHFWPNPLSIIIPTPEGQGYLDQGVGSLAVRISNQREFCQLLQQTGPLLTSSANLSGQPQAANLEEARGYFADRVDFYVEGGDLSGRSPSTIARLTNGHLQVLRQGAVTIDEKGRPA